MQVSGAALRDWGTCLSRGGGQALRHATPRHATPQTRKAPDRGPSQEDGATSAPPGRLKSLQPPRQGKRTALSDHAPLVPLGFCRRHRNSSPEKSGYKGRAQRASLSLWVKELIHTYFLTEGCTPKLQGVTRAVWLLSPAHCCSWRKRAQSGPLSPAQWQRIGGRSPRQGCLPSTWGFLMLLGKRHPVLRKN